MQSDRFFRPQLRAIAAEQGRKKERDAQYDARVVVKIQIERRGRFDLYEPGDESLCDAAKQRAARRSAFAPAAVKGVPVSSSCLK